MEPNGAAAPFGGRGVGRACLGDEHGCMFSPALSIEATMSLSPQRTTLHSRAFHQLGQFIAYKARRAGVPVVYVDPAYTTRTCAECGHLDRANRVSQAWFACRSCGFVGQPDRSGSRNIRARAWELWRRGVQSTAPAPPPRQPGGTGRRCSATASGARCASPAASATGS
ncbi:zinc ribbon domain-containing protein [Streptomyces sp. NPDC055722]